MWCCQSSKTSARPPCQIASLAQDGEIHVWSSGWGPEGLQALGRESGMLGSWKAVLQGNYDAIPHTSIWRHR